MFFRNFAALACAVGVLATTPYELDRRDTCDVGDGGGSPIVYIHIFARPVTYPVYIKTHVPSNTIININGGFEIHVTNAPTYLQTSVLVTTTTTITSTATVGVTDSATTGPTPTPIPFILSVAAPAVLERRQSSSVSQEFVGPEGNSTDDCSTASIFTLQNDMLVSDGEPVSTNTGTFAMAFAASPIIGNISTVFSLYEDVLSWNNSAFKNGTATFCALNGTTQVIFGSANTTAVCPPQILSAIPASACVSGTIVSSTSSSSSSTSSSTSTIITSSYSLTNTSTVVTPSITTIASASASASDSAAASASASASDSALV